MKVVALEHLKARHLGLYTAQIKKRVAPPGRTSEKIMPNFDAKSTNPTSTPRLDVEESPVTASNVSPRGRAPLKPVPPGRKRNGRTPRIADPKVVTALLENLALGLSVENSSHCAGMSTFAYYRALDMAQLDDPLPIYADFAQAVDRARAKCEKDAVTAVKAGFDEDWRAGAWWLERAMPGQYGKRIVFEHHADSVVINLNIGTDARAEEGKAPKAVEVVVETTSGPLIPLETTENQPLLESGSVDNQELLL